MPLITDSLRLLSEPTRLRLLLMLEAAELTVAELQEIMSMKQSRISSQLALLKNAGLVDGRRSGKNSLYSLTAQGSRLRELLRAAGGDLPEKSHDERALALVLLKRTDKARAYFDALAGKFGRSYVPGRSWKGLAEALLHLVPSHWTIADLGAGEGTLAQLLARRAHRVYAVDSSEQMIAYGTRVAAENGFPNLEYLRGDLDDPPLPAHSVDLVLMSQALHHAQRPAFAIKNAFRILKPGGKIVILDLLCHDFEKARELYAHVWLGFGEAELLGFLEDAGFTTSQVSIVDKEASPPYFQTILGIAEKS